MFLNLVVMISIRSICLFTKYSAISETFVLAPSPVGLFATALYVLAISQSKFLHRFLRVLIPFWPTTKRMVLIPFSL